MADGQVIPLIPVGKRWCYLTGKLREATPEEEVRQRWARSLVEEYGYAKSDLGIAVTIQMGRKRKQCDLAIYRTGAPHKQAYIVAIVEAKRDDIKSSDDKYGEDQLISYMAASPACRHGLWVGQERRAYQKNADGSPEPVPDIPRAGGEGAIRRPRRSDLRTVHELRSTFQRCHNYIYGNVGIQKAEAFHEMLKLIFCKTYEELEGGDELDFSIHPDEQKSIAGQRRLMTERLAPLFERVKDAYPHIFRTEETIDLPPKVVAYIVAELQFLSLLQCETDVKGEAYETIVGANLRGDRGEHFTPRNVCQMTVDIIMSLFKESRLTSLKVIDCCCGTGGFFVSWMNALREIIKKQEERRGGSAARIRERVRAACGQNLYGVDFNPALVKTAQMNLVIHGDGSVNVCQADSLKRPGEWPDPARAVPYGKFDIVITNPPFGKRSVIDDGHILSQYELASYGNGNAGLRPHMPPEQLFVEAALNFLKPGGICGMVVPDGILTNPGLRFLREWLLRRSQIIASIALPKETFAQNEGVQNPSVLIVRKFSREQLRDVQRNLINTAYSVFMSAPTTCGQDRRGKRIYMSRPDGTLALDEKGLPISDDKVLGVAEVFRSQYEPRF